MKSVITDELRLLVTAEVDQAMKQMKAFEAQTGRNKKTLASLSRDLNQFGSTMNKWVTLPFAGATAYAVKAAMDFEKVRVSYGSLLNSVKDGNKLFEDLKDFSAKTPLRFDGINKAAQGLLGAGVATNKVVKSLSMLGDVAMGDAAKLERLSLQFGKMKTKGKASLEELNVFMESGVPIIQELADNYGVTTQEIFKMVSAGKVGFSDVEKALSSLTSEGGKFYNQMKNVSETSAGKLSTALDNLKISASEFGVELLPIFNELLDKGTELLKSFSKLDEGEKKFILIGGAVAALIGPTAKLSSNILNIGSALKKLAVSQSVTTLLPLLLNPTTALVLGGGALAGAGIGYSAHLYKRNKELSNTTVEDFSEFRERQQKAEFEKIMPNTLEKFITNLENPLNIGGFKADLQLPDDLRKDLREIAKTERGQSILESFKTWQKDMLESLSNASSSNRDYLEQEYKTGFNRYLEKLLEVNVQIKNSKETEALKNQNQTNHAANTFQATENALSILEQGFKLKDKMLQLASLDLKAQQEINALSDQKVALEREGLAASKEYSEIQKKLNKLTRLTKGFATTKREILSSVYQGELNEAEKKEELLAVALDIGSSILEVSSIEARQLQAINEYKDLIDTEIKTLQESLLKIADDKKIKEIKDKIKNLETVSKTMSESDSAGSSSSELTEEDYINAGQSVGLQLISGIEKGVNYKGEELESLIYSVTDPIYDQLISLGAQAANVYGPLVVLAGALVKAIGKALIDLAMFAENFVESVNKTIEPLEKAFEDLFSNEKKLSDLRSEFIDLELEKAKNSYDEQMKLLDSKYNSEKKILEDMYKAGVITADTYQQRLIDLEKTQQNQKSDIESKHNTQQDKINKFKEAGDTVKNSILETINNQKALYKEKFKTSYEEGVAVEGSGNIWGKYGKHKEAADYLEKEIQDLYKAIALIDSGKIKDMEGLKALLKSLKQDTSYVDIFAAASGADFIASKPTLMLAGEAGSEHVKITPAPKNSTQSPSSTQRQIIININSEVYGVEDLTKKITHTMKELSVQGVL